MVTCSFCLGGVVEQRCAFFGDFGRAYFELLVLFNFLRAARGQLFELFECIGRSIVRRHKLVGDDLEAQDAGFRFLVEPVVSTPNFGQRRSLFS